MKNKEYLSALQCLLDANNLTCGIFRTKYPYVADDIIFTLKKRKAITILTDDTIWHVDRREVKIMVEYYKGRGSLSKILKDNWKTCLEVLGTIVTIIGVLVAIL